VQERAEHVDRAALQAFAADQDLVAVGAVDVPAVGAKWPRSSRLPSEPEATTSTASGTSGWRVRMVCQVCSRAATSRLAVPSGVVVWLDGWCIRGFPFLVWAGRVLAVAAAARPTRAARAGLVVGPL
jgi:hypothetical protein